MFYIRVSGHYTPKRKYPPKIPDFLAGRSLIDFPFMIPLNPETAHFLTGPEDWRTGLPTLRLCLSASQSGLPWRDKSLRVQNRIIFGLGFATICVDTATDIMVSKING